MHYIQLAKRERRAKRSSTPPPSSQEPSPSSSTPPKRHHRGGGKRSGRTGRSRHVQEQRETVRSRSWSGRGSDQERDEEDKEERRSRKHKSRSKVAPNRNRTSTGSRRQQGQEFKFNKETLRTLYKQLEQIEKNWNRNGSGGGRPVNCQASEQGWASSVEESAETDSPGYHKKKSDKRTLKTTFSTGEHDVDDRFVYATIFLRIPRQRLDSGKLAEEN